MKTSDLITALSQDLKPTRPFGASFALTLAPRN